ncbi:hypothetical protein DRQ05_02905 [bacterium]|nr:MAG: hypothetical protein DRQ05_02905 [bacterium]
MSQRIEASGSASTATCPICGRKFPCGASGPEMACWCFYFPPVDVSFLKSKGIEICICPSCLRRIAIQQGYHEDLLPNIKFTETDWYIV